MAIRVCVAGVTGWTGGEVTKAILASNDFELAGAIARRSAGQDVGQVLGMSAKGIVVAADLAEALARPADVLVDYTSPGSVKQRTLEALARGLRVVIGTSGLTAADYQDIERTANERRLGVIAAGNFSITAALAKHFALLAAKHLPSWEIIDYAQTPPAARPVNWPKRSAKSPRTGRPFPSSRPTAARTPGAPRLAARRSTRFACRVMSWLSRRSSASRTSVSRSATTPAKVLRRMFTGRYWRYDE